MSTVAEQKEELAEWLWHDEGYSSARVELARARLPKDDQAVFDVLGETAVRILGRLERSGSIDDHPDGRSGVGPYARRTLHHVVIDAVRGPRHRLEVLVDNLTAEADHVDVTDVETVALDAVARPSLRHEVRHGLHSSLDHRAPWVAAAALTVVTVADDSAPDLPEGTPQPEGGEGAPYWAGLHLAGRTDCFTRPDTGAVRERRRRAVGRVRGLLQRVTREIQQAAPSADQVALRCHRALEAGQPPVAAHCSTRRPRTPPDLLSTSRHAGTASSDRAHRLATH